MSPRNLRNSAITFMCWLTIIHVEYMTRKHCYETKNQISKKHIPLPRELAKKKKAASILRTMYHAAYVRDDVLAKSIGSICLIGQEMTGLKSKS